MSDRLDDNPEDDAYPRASRDAVKLAVAEEAAQWFVRVKDEHPSRAAQKEYLHWLQASPDHVAAALRAGQVYGLLRYSRLHQIGSSGEVSNVVELRAGIAQHPEVGPVRARSRSRWRKASSRRDALRRQRRHSRLRAGVVALVVLCGVLFVLVRVIVPDRTVSTEPSEWRHFTLADGSIVRAGPRTDLRFEFTDARRYVQLSDGEAVFQVASDSARPFLVAAGVAVVRAVGTQFAVSRTGDRVLITVAEGTVSVTHAATPTRWFSPPDTHEATRPAVPVAAGEQAAIAAGGPVTVQRVNVASALAWAQGKLIFDDQNVADAVIEFNRRNRVQIEIDDPAIASRPVRGVFDAADPESFAQFIAHAAHATIVREPNVVRLHGIDPPPVAEAPDPASAAHDDDARSAPESPRLRHPPL